LGFHNQEYIDAKIIELAEFDVYLSALEPKPLDKRILSTPLGEFLVDAVELLEYKVLRPECLSPRKYLCGYF
jgi:hypothetical protein